MNHQQLAGPKQEASVTVFTNGHVERVNHTRHEQLLPHDIRPCMAASTDVLGMYIPLGASGQRRWDSLVLE